MSLRKPHIDLEPTTSAREIFRLVSEVSGDVDLRLGDKVLHVYGTVTETLYGYPVFRTSDQRDEVEKRAHEALLELKMRDTLMLVTDERSGRQSYVTRGENGERSRDPDTPHDVETFIENVAELGELVDFDRIADSIEQQRQFDISKSNRT